jgi:hypothetical protein
LQTVRITHRPLLSCEFASVDPAVGLVTVQLKNLIPIRDATVLARIELMRIRWIAGSEHGVRLTPAFKQPGKQSIYTGAIMRNMGGQKGGLPSLGLGLQLACFP